MRLVRESERELAEQAPPKAEAFKVYSETLYEHLFQTWDSPLAVNNAATDAHFEMKHKYQDTLYGEKQRHGWEAWNQHFLEQIVNAAGKYQGMRILALVGVEHAYWLRRRLRDNKDLKLVLVEDSLKGFSR